MFTKLQNFIASVRKRLVVRRRLSKDSLHQLAVVRRVAAQDPRTPKSSLCSLANDIDLSVRIALAKNPQLPDIVVSHLLKDTNKEVRYSLSGNRAVALPFLRQLAIDTDLSVARRAAQTLDTMGAAGRHRDVARNR
jgi:hypothetical protein